MRGSLVYKFSCVQCTSMYVGSTSRTLISRAAEHAGRSPRTNKPIVNPSQSSIRCHGNNNCSPDVSLDTFEILDSVSNSQDLRILESIYIYRLRPNLNENSSSYPLNILTN